MAPRRPQSSSSRPQSQQQTQREQLPAERKYEIPEQPPANETVSIIIRTIDNRFDSLEKAIFSIYCNSYADKEVIIVYQGLSEKYAEELASLREIYPDLPIQVIHNPTERDARAQNANLGIMAASGRYIGFLDDDDVLYSSHIKKIHAAIKATGRAWAYAQVCLDIEQNGYIIRKERPFLHNEFSFLRLWESNYIPCHSFLVDLAKIPDRQFAFFVDHLSKHEDYGMVLRMALHYEPAVVTDVTCIYKVRQDGSNTIMHFGNALSETERRMKNEQWEIATAEIKKLKNELTKDLYWFKEVKFPSPYVVYSHSLKGYIKERLKQYRLVRRLWYIYCTLRMKTRAFIARG